MAYKNWCDPSPSPCTHRHCRFDMLGMSLTDPAKTGPMVPRGYQQAGDREDSSLCSHWTPSQLHPHHNSSALLSSLGCAFLCDMSLIIQLPPVYFPFLV